MHDIMERYDEYLVSEELAEGTRRIYLREAERFIQFATIDQITKRQVMNYKTKESLSGLHANTINLHLIAVNKFLRFLGREACCVKLNRVQKVSCVSNVLSKDEYQSLCDYAQQSGRIKYYHILRTLAGTGIRISELSFFTVESIGRGVITVCNKGKSRDIFVPQDIVEELMVYCKTVHINSGAVFLGNGGKPISRTAVFKMLKHLADMVGVPEEKVYPHSFRHLFALTYMEKYHNLSELADILGHASLETTRMYVSNSTEQKLAKIQAMGLL